MNQEYDAYHESQMANEAAYAEHLKQMDELIDACKIYAITCHGQTNHFYDGKPYGFHLQMVVDMVLKFKYLAPDLELCIAGAWVHDVIEDCRISYHQVKENCGLEVAEIAYALTNEKGRSRKERANGKYYEGIRSNKNAHFVKICDRLANIKYSIENKSSMENAYQKEDSEFRNYLYEDKFSPMFIYMTELLNNHK